MWLFLLFVSVPLIEIALFIEVGGLIGLWPTLVIVALTAMIGTWMIRQQGAMALAQLRRSFQDLRDPAEPLAHGAMILFSGALLLTPGFFTDTVGFLLLVPAVRAAAYRWMSRRMVVRTMSFGPPPDPRRHQPGNVIDGDFEEVRPGPHDTGRPSGWTRH